jgi:hypothetical protein
MTPAIQIAFLALSLWGAEPTASAMIEPLPHQVVQREGFDRLKAHEHQPGGPALGFANVAIKAKIPALPQELFEFRTVLLTEAFGKPVDWTQFEHQRDGTTVAGTVKISAGGWYRLEVRQRVAQETKSIAAVEPFGVGEVFIIAGQSYADGANDELEKVTEPQGRVVAYDVKKKTWQVAHDPQPNKAPGGTIWPALGDFLVPVARVPVGFVNVAVGGTASRQWMPGEPLYQGLDDAGQQMKHFRAVLWQQGESDVIENVSTAKYVENLSKIRQSLAISWHNEPTWLLAKSTLHPTVYNDPVKEGQIRDAIQQLSQQPGFRPGPDTDTLGGENRGGINSRRHFSAIGQRRAALLWFAAVWTEIHSDPAERNPKGNDPQDK